VPAWSDSSKGACEHLCLSIESPEFLKGGSSRLASSGAGTLVCRSLFVLAEAGHKVTGFDTDPAKISLLNAGRSYIEHIPQTKIQQYVNSRHFSATTDFAKLKEVDAVLICVPDTARRAPRA